MSFLGVLETVGKDFEKGLKWAAGYAVPAEKLIALLFPEFQPVMTGIIDATNLVQNAVLLVEQKYAAAGAQHGTGAAKLGEVLQLTTGAVLALLEKAGVGGDPAYVERLVTAVVSILNVQPAPASPTAAA